MEYISVKQAAEKWGLSRRRVQVLCLEGKIEGAQRVGSVWVIPVTAQKPADARTKTGCGETPAERRTGPLLIERKWSMPNKHTFDIPPIHALIQEERTPGGLWIDPFANQNKLADLTNDLNPVYDTDYHLDALDFLKLFQDESVDGVLYDPPYSPRQVSECYHDVGYDVTWDTTKASFWSNHKREISRIVKPGGKVITFGWNSGGIGYQYGFEISRILMVPHGGWHNDTICTVEIKTHSGRQRPQKARQSAAEKTTQERKTMRTDTDERLVRALQNLPAGFWDFQDEDTHAYTHGIHTYPAMMVAPISRNILQIVKDIQPVTAVLDPFAGSGTVLVESMLAGIPLIGGNDINPFAQFLCRTKTTPLDMDELQAVASFLDSALRDKLSRHADALRAVNPYMQEKQSLDLAGKKGWGSDAPAYLQAYCRETGLDVPVPVFKNLGYWFKPRVILELAMIQEEIRKIAAADIRAFILTAFSETIRLVSNKRNGEFKMFRMPPDKVRRHEPPVYEEFFRLLTRNMEKMHAFVEAYQEAGASSDMQYYADNACSLDHIPDDRYDLIITSPPYGDSRTTVAYGEYCRLSLQWLGLNGLTEKEIMGVDKSLMGGVKYRNGFAFTLGSPTLKASLSKIKDHDLERAGDVYSFYLDLDQAIASIAKKTRSGGYHFWVVGNRTVKGEVLKTDQIIAELAAAHNMQYVYTIDRNIPNKVMPSRNSPTNESGKTATTMTMEHIVLLRKI